MVAAGDDRRPECRYDHMSHPAFRADPSGATRPPARAGPKRGSAPLIDPRSGRLGAAWVMLPAFGFAPVRGWGRGWRVSPLPKLPVDALKPIGAAAILTRFHSPYFGVHARHLDGNRTPDERSMWRQGCSIGGAPSGS